MAHVLSIARIPSPRQGFRHSDGSVEFDSGSLERGCLRMPPCSRNSLRHGGSAALHENEITAQFTPSSSAGEALRSLHERGRGCRLDLGCATYGTSTRAARPVSALLVAVWILVVRGTGQALGQLASLKFPSGTTAAMTAAFPTGV